jgi:hypothetical protein
MNTPHFAASVATLAVVGCAACSPSTATSDNSSMPSLCDRLLVAAPKRLLARCCADTATAELQPLLAQIDLEAEECRNRLGPSLAHGRLEVDAGQSADCAAGIDEIVEAPHACINYKETLVTLMREGTRACARALVGRVHEGGTCASANDCAEGLSCRGWTLAFPPKGIAARTGVCVQPPGLDEECGGGGGQLDDVFSPQPHCAAGTYCAFWGTCAKRSSLGQSCTVDIECDEGTVCRSNTCTDLPRSALGGACQDRSDCRDGLRCADGTCQEYFLPAGATCDSDADFCAGACWDGTCVSTCGSR